MLNHDKGFVEVWGYQLTKDTIKATSSMQMQAPR